MIFIVLRYLEVIYTRSEWRQVYLPVVLLRQLLHGIYKHLFSVAQLEFTVGQYLFQPRLRLLNRKGQQQKLSPKEAELLRMLCLHFNHVLPCKEALHQIWHEDSYFTARSMDVYIAKLRKFLKEDPTVEIINIHGQGYRLCVQNGALL